MLRKERVAALQHSRAAGRGRCRKRLGAELGQDEHPALTMLLGFRRPPRFQALPPRLGRVACPQTAVARSVQAAAGAVRR